jgi:hypothetical protein
MDNRDIEIAHRGEKIIEKSQLEEPASQKRHSIFRLGRLLEKSGSTGACERRNEGDNQEGLESQTGASPAV